MISLTSSIVYLGKSDIVTLDLIVNMMVKSSLSTTWLMWALISSKLVLVLFTNDKRFTASKGCYKDEIWF